MTARRFHSPVADKIAFDLHQRVTDQILAAMEANPGEYRTPWHRGTGSIMRPKNALTKKPYNGINILVLWCAADERGYESGAFATYKQWAEMGAQVRGGEKSSLIVFHKEHEFKPKDGADEPEKRWIAKPSFVFAAEQVDGYQIDTRPVIADPVQSVAEADAFYAATGAKVTHGGSRAFYRPATDEICLPKPEDFIGTPTSTPTQSFYAVLGHETAHWSGAPHRLNREFGKRFGDEKYSAEELVADLAGAFLCARFGIASEPRPDHAMYLSHWLKIMRSDKHAIFTAASQASKAVAYLEELVAGPARPQPGAEIAVIQQAGPS